MQELPDLADLGAVPVTTTGASPAALAVSVLVGAGQVLLDGAGVGLALTADDALQLAGLLALAALQADG